ncbi:protein of unknown function [Rhodovastum atsumiense]|nr:protein of unknown function [Rhodovastum atsumiense]
MCRVLGHPLRSPCDVIGRAHVPAPCRPAPDPEASASAGMAHQARAPLGFSEEGRVYGLLPKVE